MVLSILAYVLVLTLAAVFFLFYPGYVSFYALLLFLVLPLLSLSIVLIQRRRYAPGVCCSAAAGTRGGSVQVTFSLAGPAGEEARFAVRVDQLLYPQLSFSQDIDLRPGETLTLPLELEHCGWYKVAVTRCRVRDWLGIFSLGLPCPQPLFLLSLPGTGPIPAEAAPAPETGVPLRPRPGGGPGEEYELRPYRPGDPVSSIHWKLTAKQPSGEPVLRETLEPVKERLAVSYDHFGEPDDLDDVLDQLGGYAQMMTDKAEAFTVCFAQPISGAVNYFDIDCPRAWDACCQAISAIPAPPEGQSLPTGELTLPGWSGPVKRIHLTPRGDKGVAGS